MKTTPIWQSQLQYNSRKQPYSNVANVAKIFRFDPDFEDLFWFDQWEGVPCMCDVDPGPITDLKLIKIQEVLQLKGLERVSIQTVDDAILLVSQDHPFHPLKERIEVVKWDGNRRLCTWLHDYMGVEQNEYSDTVGTCFLISVIARIWKPGCKVDYMPVFEGPQGEEKSKAVRALAMGYYSDNLPDLTDDPIRVAQHLRGKLIIEVSDLSSFNRAETTNLKAFITRQEEIFIPKYGRKEVSEPRHGVLCGTTNKAVWMKDETGGRRFWPLQCGKIDIPGLEEAVPKLYAEARQLYGTGTGKDPDVPWWPDREFELAHITPAQEDRYEHDIWAEKIAQAYQYPAPGFHTTVTIIAKDILDIPVGQVSRADQNRIIAALEQLGWVKGKKQNFGIPWFPPKK